MHIPLLILLYMQLSSKTNWDIWITHRSEKLRVHSETFCGKYIIAVKYLQRKQL